MSCTTGRRNGKRSGSFAGFQPGDTIGKSRENGRKGKQVDKRKAAGLKACPGQRRVGKRSGAMERRRTGNGAAPDAKPLGFSAVADRAVDRMARENRPVWRTPRQAATVTGAGSREAGSGKKVSRPGGAGTHSCCGTQTGVATGAVVTGYCREGVQPVFGRKRGCGFSGTERHDD